MSFAPLRTAFYAATSGALVVGGATLMGHGPPQGATGAFLATYLGLVALGVTEPRSRIFADVMARVPEGIALTFDDGPHPQYTRAVMDALEQHDARGTFFMIARKMQQHPDVVREVLARGHAVGAHGYSHDRLYAMRGEAWLDRDADREEEVWDQTVGRVPVLYRPPIGLMNPRIARLAAERERTIVAWTVRPRDGLARTPAQRVIDRVIPRLRDGAIVLLHDTAENDARTPACLAALPAILDAAARLGLSARTVPEPTGALPATNVKELPPP